MSITEPFTISRGQARAAARALNRLADGDGPIDRDQFLGELKRVGLGPKSDRVSGARLARPPKPAGPIDPDQLESELKRLGLKDKMPEPDKRVVPPHRPPDDDATPKGRVRRTLPPPTGPPELIWARPATAARMAGVGLTLLYRWLKAGRVIGRKIDGVTLISVQSIRDLQDDPMPGGRPSPRARKDNHKEE
jgi:hypothetical protein